MPGIKYFSQDINLENKTIIIRVDLNVPIVKKKNSGFYKNFINFTFFRKINKKKIKTNYNKSPWETKRCKGPDFISVANL